MIFIPRRIGCRSFPEAEVVGYEASDHVDHTRTRPGRRELRTFLLLVLSCCLSSVLPAQELASSDARNAIPEAAHHAGLDRSGKARKGKASYYGQKFYSKKMATVRA
jgi:rare lipoprotein A